MPLAIEITNLSKTYDEIVVLENINFSVRSQSITGLIGRNGAGKTTLLSILLGLSHASSGEVKVLSAPMKNRTTNDIGFSISQGLFPSLTGKQHLQLISQLTSRRIDIQEVLKDVDLHTARKLKVKNYSLGMQQRLRLAMAISGGHRIIVLDEPLNGLDPDGISWFREKIIQLKTEGRTILISSHLLLELEKVIDDVIILDRKILWKGSIENARKLSPDGSLESYYKFLNKGDSHDSE